MREGYKGSGSFHLAFDFKTVLSDMGVMTTDLLKNTLKTDTQIKLGSSPRGGEWRKARSTQICLL